jgi:hypothetical protein
VVALRLAMALTTCLGPPFFWQDWRNLQRSRRKRQQGSPRSAVRHPRIHVSGHSRDATAIHGQVTKILRARYARETNLGLQLEGAQ